MFVGGTSAQKFTGDVAGSTKRSPAQNLPTQPGEKFEASEAEWTPVGKPNFHATTEIKPQQHAGHVRSVFAGLALACTVALMGTGCASTAPMQSSMNEGLHPQHTTQLVVKPESQAHQAGRQLNEAGKDLHKAVKPALKKGAEIKDQIKEGGKKFGLDVADKAVDVGHGFRDFFKGLGGK